MCNGLSEYSPEGMDQRAGDPYATGNSVFTAHRIAVRTLTSMRLMASSEYALVPCLSSMKHTTARVAKRHCIPHKIIGSQLAWRCEPKQARRTQPWPCAHTPGCILLRALSSLRSGLGRCCVG